MAGTYLIQDFSFDAPAHPTPEGRGLRGSIGQVLATRRLPSRVRLLTSQMHHSHPKNNVPAYIQRDQWPYLQWLGVTLSEGTLSKMRGIARRNP